MLKGAIRWRGERIEERADGCGIATAAERLGGGAADVRQIVFELLDQNRNCSAVTPQAGRMGGSLAHRIVAIVES